MATLNSRIKQLEQTVTILLNRIADLSANTENKLPSPHSKVGKGTDRAVIKATDAKTGLGFLYGGAVVWNNTELGTPPLNAEPALPELGYNKHTHSRYSGGALIKDYIEIVEYDFNDTPISNKHSQGYWQDEPKIKKVLQSDGNSVVEKIGILDLVFNPDTETWGTSAYEIDVKKCYLVTRDADGDIELDSNGNEKKSLLYNEDATKSAVVWDENAQVWRFYAVYAPDPIVS